jgi:hypothetical protein
MGAAAQPPSQCEVYLGVLCGNYSHQGKACFDCIYEEKNEQILSHLCAGSTEEEAFCNKTALARVIQDYSDLGGKPYTVEWDSRSMRLNDSPTMLLSGSIHYTRSTPAMWPALFAEARANGLNSIESYVFW